MTSSGSSLMFVDSHAHLDDEQFRDDLANVVARAEAAGVRQIVNIGYEPAKWSSTVRLARQFESIALTLGLHPQSADQFTGSLMKDLESSLVEHGACAVGEIGIDLFRSGPS